MEAEVTIDEVRTFDTRGGNVRYVIRDSDGNEYTTFREPIGEAAKRLEGRRAQIEYHESRRGQYTNVYLDRVEAAPEERGGAGSGTDPEEAAWRTAVEAAPWLVGESEPHEEVPPDELYEKLKPFKERVAEDIRDDGPEDTGDGGSEHTGDGESEHTGEGGPRDTGAPRPEDTG